MSLKSSQPQRPLSFGCLPIRNTLLTLVCSLAFSSAAMALGKELPALPVEEVPQAAETHQPLDLTTPAVDLWSRLRNGFAMTDLNNDLVTYYEQRYQAQPEYLRRMVERSRRYMHHILDELEKRGMPTEIALLPMVESAMNPLAYSRAHASGLWQFIPSTGKSYNLTQDWWKDERRDVVASTNAALEYLQTIYELHGDWHLALASYNWGENAVGRAIRRNEAAGLPTDYDSLNMPKETRHYVPKLQALKNIFGNPALVAQLNLPSLDNKPYFATVNPPGTIDVKVAAKLAEMPVEEFVALNPAHNRPVIKADSTLVVPTDRVGTFMENLKEYANKPLTSWKTYSARLGEKLESIASRMGVALADLKRVNGLYGQVKLSEGHMLLVPSKDGVGGLEDIPQEMTSVAAMGSPRMAGSSPRFHVVRRGDTLPNLASKYGVSMADLKHLNSLKSTTLKPGLRLSLGSQVQESRPLQGSTIPMPSVGKSGKSARASATKPSHRPVAKSGTKAASAKRSATPRSRR